jgi:hypothetical protein
MLVGTVAAVAGLAVVISAASAKAMMIAPPPLSTRVAQADCIVVGKVTSIEDKVVAAKSFPTATQKTAYRIAVITIKDHLAGAKGLTSVRVGFIPPPQPVQGGPNQPIRPIRRYPTVDLKVGQEGCFLLTQHFEEPFYIVQGYYNVIYKANNFDQQVAQIKDYVKLLDDPKEGLKSKNADSRLVTAAMLMTRYRTVKLGTKPPYKTEPIDAEQSKLILNVLAEADWTKVARFGQVSPWLLFNQLGLTAKDGWKPPQLANLQAMGEAAKEWIKQHAKDYRIQRYVAEKAEKK